MNAPDTERSVERLIKLAGERDVPSPEGTERARRAAHETWMRTVGQGRPLGTRRTMRMVVGLAMAASLAALALYTSIHRPAAGPTVLVARIATLDGAATLRENVGETAARTALPVHAGDTLVTGTGRVALTFGDSLSLRVDRHTRLRFDSREQITLLQGALYVDSGGVNTVPALRIETPAGEVRHVGTQFQVRVGHEVTQLRVREGRVLLMRAVGEPTEIATGDELQVRGADLHWQHGLPSFGPDWEWSAEVAPPLEIENRPLAEFLAWMTREHGWQLRHADAALQQRTHEIRLHGSLDQLDAAAMVERVSLVTGVELHAQDGVLWVGGKQR
jgi:ferric-dicitrate binding protein FerR (iron transport regulator)